MSYIGVGSYFVIYPYLCSKIYGNKLAAKVSGFIFLGAVGGCFT